MNDRIEKALSKLFERHRIIFWYDSKQELRSDFETLQLDGVEKIEINKNEFTLKYRLLREQPKQRFLLYKEGQQPEDVDNWLLDVQLSEGEFRTDQSAIWLSELELPNEFIDIVEDHSPFFESDKRKQTLKHLLKPDDTFSAVRLKMLAVCVGSDARLDNIVEQLLATLVFKRRASEKVAFDKGANKKAGDTDDAYQLLTQCHLVDFFWQQLERSYAYQSDCSRKREPSLKDFVISLFGWSYYQSLSAHGKVNQPDLVALNSDALVFLKRWKDSRTYQKAFESLSSECASILNIEADLNQREVQELIELDYFKLIDQKIISGLVRAVEERTLSAGDITLWCRQRRMTHWFDEYKHLYNAIEVASQFVALLDTVQFNMPSATEALQSYTRHWYKLDQFYRQYIYALKVSGQTSLLSSLTEQIENLYTNRYLLPLNNEWQAHVDGMKQWQVSQVTPQTQFFERWVKPFSGNKKHTNKKKVFVIISDAFRFEAGEEMVSLIRQEDRYQAELDYLLSSLPSYTQLGMASLLPLNELSGSETQSRLSLADDKTATTYLNGQSTQGTNNRDKLLKEALGERAAAVQSKDLMEMTNTESRALLKAHDVIYFYHNRIDHTGDKMQSEGEAFEATEKTFSDLMRLIKKLTNANASNILITADHGFTYQNRAIDESDFLSAEVDGDVLYRDRRFLLGKSLKSGHGLRVFSADELNLAGDVGALIPKGIQRLRLKGSGSRFVHGGASLQEVVVPVIKINKKRQSDTRAVDVDILRSGSTVITSGQLAVTLYQAKPVTEKVQARYLRAGIYTEDNQLISDQHELVLDLTSDNTREREMKLRFLLTQEADAANEQEVILRLDEPVSGTNHFKEYKSLRYTLRRSFTSDFDF
jgi:uncharacterized protein (TIGR02687 family)